MNEKQERIKVIEAQLKKDSNDVPLPILEAEHEALVDTVNKLQSQADEMKQRNGPTVGLIETLLTWLTKIDVCLLFFLLEQLDPAVFMKLQQERDKKLQEFYKRKRLSLNMIDAIMEGYPKSKQKLIEDTEIETDEAAGFDINQYKWTILNLLSASLVLRCWCCSVVPTKAQKKKRRLEVDRKWHWRRRNEIEAISSDW